jgi:hypothetical protein
MHVLGTNVKMRFRDVEMKAVNVIIMQQRKATIENAFKWMPRSCDDETFLLCSMLHQHIPKPLY